MQQRISWSPNPWTLHQLYRVDIVSDWSNRWDLNSQHSCRVFFGKTPPKSSKDRVNNISTERCKVWSRVEISLSPDCLKKGLDPKLHLFLLSRKAVWPTELLMRAVPLFYGNSSRVIIAAYLQGISIDILQARPNKIKCRNLKGRFHEAFSMTVELGNISTGYRIN